MRAPEEIKQHNSRLIAARADITVLAENMQFECPALHKGKADYTAMFNKFCKAKIVYEVQSAKAQKVRLKFLFSGGRSVLWQAGNSSETRKSEKLQGNEKDSFCRFCPERKLDLYQSEMVADFSAGKSQIVIQYEQKLDFREYDYGYLSDGKWKQGFNYEIWPLHEWKKSSDFKINVSIQLPYSSSYLGLKRNNYALRCAALKKDLSDTGKSIEIKVSEQKQATSYTFFASNSIEVLACEYSE